jgi:hypothetical protein
VKGGKQLGGRHETAHSHIQRDAVG